VDPRERRSYVLGALMSAGLLLLVAVRLFTREAPEIESALAKPFMLIALGLFLWFRLRRARESRAAQALYVIAVLAVVASAESPSLGLPDWMSLFLIICAAVFMLLGTGRLATGKRQARPESEIKS